ncbi:TetR/AcrR family transcriptional regulator [Nocardia sp. alder85J]|uniref:TetR/AcrR family transcriptional regulator n=1 Tax=Nocardia sp. alder85J TaxID=2862949 RepID=UPI001CD573D9|nr:TetR/AcrR family transcriptional regulator [Nocardia sp. alder85J]MCX4095402.1 TetR/AcrR family transcriptional regulator [Nocardia sp. alder85J]
MRRTRDALHRALIELMLATDYRRITVQDVLDRADVGRSTFYAHYRDKDDLLVTSCTAYLRAAIDATTAAHPDHSSPLAPLHTMFELAASNKPVYGVLLGPKAGAPVLRATRQMAADILTDLLTGHLNEPPDDFADTVTYLSWALFGLLGAVADPARDLSPTAAYHRFHRLTTTGLPDLLPHPH